MLNRRNFIGNTLTALAGFAILPGAGRLWVTEQKFRYVDIDVRYCVRKPLSIAESIYTVFEKRTILPAIVGPKGELTFNVTKEFYSVDGIRLRGIDIPTPFGYHCSVNDYMNGETKIPLTTCFSVSEILDGKITPENLADELAKS